MTRRSPSDPPPPLLWDGHTLHGTATGRAEAWVPARFLSLRRESLPNAPTPALKAAARLRADRAFAPLGPVAVDALLHPAQGGTVDVLLVAMPAPMLEAIRRAAEAKGVSLRAVRVAELMRAVPAGGVVTVGGENAAAPEASLVAMEGGRVSAICALGNPEDEGFAQRLARERLRLGADATAPGGPAPGTHLDFLAPGLLAAEPMLARSGVRLGLLAAAVALAAAAGLLLLAYDAVRERAQSRTQLAQLGPEAGELAAFRADLKALAPWFEARQDMAPCLHALCGALPPPGAADQMRLMRVRQAPGETAVVEGSAGDRAQMLAFLGRLRRDPRVTQAEIRSFRSPSHESAEVVFELGLRTDGARRPAPSNPTTAKTGGADEPS